MTSERSSGAVAVAVAEALAGVWEGTEGLVGAAVTVAAQAEGNYRKHAKQGEQDDERKEQRARGKRSGQTRPDPAPPYTYYHMLAVVRSMRRRNTTDGQHRSRAYTPSRPLSQRVSQAS
ncbi:uncharacterized protein K452DRAFT_308128 [Aplosporella prunicola CBS 121167]|uniref:Uncharacterized protein n=1 Tax=Aplosporella prunicola CBS 121167 TaxID=1176127 RepID=A0A6A6BIT2_9PEZI|nr:uncharacterized protein K452DRAFT_308128 [Aplosporella prunicola CBS 121167]KAF2142471.1 hypothetical protein K452DRAFT_308128 [Aplosporella prunicola CBS 121167]